MLRGTDEPRCVDSKLGKRVQFIENHVFKIHTENRNTQNFDVVSFVNPYPPANGKKVQIATFSAIFDGFPSFLFALNRLDVFRRSLVFWEMFTGLKLFRWITG